MNAGAEESIEREVQPMIETDAALGNTKIRFAERKNDKKMIKCGD